MSDQLVKQLNRFGYQPVFLPKTGLLPPELYNFVKPALKRRGPLVDYMAEVSQVKMNNGRLADIEGKCTSGKNFKAAADFLKSALAALGISSVPKLDLSFAGGNELTFAFSNVTYQAVDPSQLDKILQKLAVPASIPDNYVTDGDLHIVYEYAYANTIRMSRADQKSFSTDVSGKVGDFVDLGTNAKVEVHGNNTISFSTNATEPAAFAYKAGRLQRVTDIRWIFEPEVVMRATEAMGLAAATPPTFVPAPGIVLVAVDEPAVRSAGSPR